MSVRDLNNLGVLVGQPDGCFWVAFAVSMLCTATITTILCLRRPASPHTRFFVHSLASMAVILFAMSAAVILSVFDILDADGYQTAAMLVFIGVLPTVALLVLVELMQSPEYDRRSLRAKRPVKKHKR